MQNKIEILRAICFTKEDLSNIQNLGNSFTDKDIEFMVEFKKIYELGTGQLKVFIDKLDSEGTELDTYSIQYYVDVLSNGPLREYVSELSVGKKYFGNSSDCMGCVGNTTTASQNTTLFENTTYSLGTGVDVFNKLPSFMQITLTSSLQQTEEVFRSSVRSSMVHDNTLPISDKAPQLRYDEEPVGTWTTKSRGSYMVKDKNYYLETSRISLLIYEAIMSKLGDEQFRVWNDKKTYNAFDSSTNESTATNIKVEKIFIENNDSVVHILDLMGDEFDSEDKRGSTLTIINDSKDKSYLLNTVEGQLGT